MNEHPFAYLQQRLQALREQSAYRQLVPREQNGLCLTERDGRKLVNFGTNDYLGLGTRSGVPVFNAIDQQSSLASGAGASALVSGYTAYHQQLADVLADWEQTESAVLFPSGYAACSGTVATLAEDGDLLLSDSLNHASLIDGCRLSRATRMVYPHVDTDAIQQLLRQHRHRFARAWIVTEGVFGMDGDIAPLPDICNIAEQFDAQVIVDEAHGTGVLGGDGSGACAEQGIKSRVPIRIGTLSKALGSHGGFVVGPRLVIDYLINRCRTLLFSTAGSPLTIAAAIDHVRIAREGLPLRQKVQQHAARLRERLQQGALSCHAIGGHLHVPIVPVVLGENQVVLNLAQGLRDHGMFVPAIRPPTVPEGSARLRISLSAAHTEAQVVALADALLLLLGGEC